MSPETKNQYGSRHLPGKRAHNAVKLICFLFNKYLKNFILFSVFIRMKVETNKKITFELYFEYKFCRNY